MYKIKFQVTPGSNINGLVRLCENSWVTEFNVGINVGKSSLLPMIEITLCTEHIDTAAQIKKDVDSLKQVIMSNIEEYYDDEEDNSIKADFSDEYSMILRKYLGRIV